MVQALTNLVTVSENDQVITTSLKVAEVFEKEHHHVLRDIDELMKLCNSLKINENPNLDSRNSMFEEYYDEVKTPTGGTKKVRRFAMNRDGFTLLVMGYRSQKAIQFKLVYIDAFNRMEKELKARQEKQSAFDVSQITRRQLAQMLLESETEREELEAENKELHGKLVKKEEQRKRAWAFFDSANKENVYHRTEMHRYKRAADTWHDAHDDLMETFQDVSRENQKLTEKIDNMNNKLETYSQILKSDDAHSMGEVANLLNFKNVGRNNIYKLLRKLNIIQRDRRPYQKYVDRGFFDVKVNKEFNTCQTVVYPKGIEFIRKKLIENGYEPQYFNGREKVCG